MSWPKFITHNLGWKLVSVLLATLIWFIAQRAAGTAFRSESLRVFSDLPVLVLTPAEDSRVFRVHPPVVRLGVRGPEALLNRLAAADITVFLNLTGGVNASATRRPLEVHLPRGLAIVWREPAEVDVEVSGPAAAPATNAALRTKTRP